MKKISAFSPATSKSKSETMATRRIAFRRAISVLVATVAALLLLFSPSSADAFLPPSTTSATAVKNVDTARSKSALSAFPLVPEFLDGILGGGGSPPPDQAASLLDPLVEEARGKFWFYFLAGSGAGGIGLAQVPAVFRDASSARAASAAKRTPRGGGGAGGGGSATTLDAGPFVRLYYDSEIYAEDLVDAIRRAPTSQYISGRSTSKNFMATRGYIERGDFAKEMDTKDCDPLASYVLFDAISAGKGGVVSPVVYDEKLEAYREGTVAGWGKAVASSFAVDMNVFLAVKLGAFVGLVFCLFVDFGLVAKNGITGFL